MISTITTFVKDGRITRNRNEFAILIKAFNDKEIDITIKKHKKQRSTPQNAYYWGLVLPVVREGLKDVTGDYYTNSDIHEILKGKFLKVDIEVNGEMLPKFKSTTDLSTIEMEEYLERIKAFASEYLNIIVPDPNEQLRID